MLYEYYYFVSAAERSKFMQTLQLACLELQRYNTGQPRWYEQAAECHKSTDLWKVDKADGHMPNTGFSDLLLLWFVCNDNVCINARLLFSFISNYHPTE